jgi:hypothetical protein
MRSAGAMTKGPSTSSPFPPPQDPHPPKIPTPRPFHKLT